MLQVEGSSKELEGHTGSGKSSHLVSTEWLTKGSGTARAEPRDLWSSSFPPSPVRKHWTPYVLLPDSAGVSLLIPHLDFQVLVGSP